VNSRLRCAAEVSGRVNLIGEHTDYNFGYVLPTVIPQTCRVQYTGRDDDLVSAQSREEKNKPTRYQLGSEMPHQQSEPRQWWHYVQGVTWRLRQHGHRLRGCDLRIESDVPLGSGLSSSAAMDVALLRVLCQANNIKLEELELAKLAQEVENKFVAAPVGILDPLACHLGRAGEALFVDTQNLAIERVPLPAEVELIVIHSGMAHQHAGGDYQTRVAECHAAARALGVPNLRAVGMADLSRIEKLPTPLKERARHVVTENQRVLDAVSAMKQNDLIGLGQLFNASHASQHDDYGVSIPEVDRLVEIAQKQPGIYGARLTGGGFGGSIVALAKKGLAQGVAHAIANEYQAQTGIMPRVLVPA
jgi:galactokinase